MAKMEKIDKKMEGSSKELKELKSPKLEKVDRKVGIVKERDKSNRFQINKFNTFGDGWLLNGAPSATKSFLFNAELTVVSVRLLEDDFRKTSIM